MSGRRRRARVKAFQTLFEVEVAGHDPEVVLERQLQSGVSDVVSAEYARRLVMGVQEHVEELDRLIRSAAPAWPLDQMSKVDKNILRLALFEALFNNEEVPIKVAINEAVELAKIFGSESTGRFVNGVLGTIVTRIASAPQTATMEP